MPKASKKADRQQQIVRGLMRALAKRGYAGAPISAIASEAGLTPGLLHYYFKGKQEILLALMDTIQAEVLDRLGSRLARAGGDPWERLFAFTDALLEADDSADADDAAACWVAIAAEAVHEPVLRQRYRASLEELAQRLSPLLADVFAAEGRSTDVLDSAAAAITALIQGVHHLDRTAPDLAPLGSSAPLARQMIAGMILGQPSVGQRNEPNETGPSQKRRGP